MAQIILLSGGMDSLISHRVFYPDALPVFVRSGARYTLHDYKMANQQVPRLSLLCLPNLHERPDGVVPHRNSILLSAVANQFNADEIIVSAPRGELIWDQQPAFHRAMEKVLRGVKITNPLRRLTKTQAVAAWLARGLPRAELLASRSCYSETAHQCGACAACVKRWIALTNNGIEEFYQEDPYNHAFRLVEELSVPQLVGYAARYGLRPAWEAYEALRK